MKAMIVRALQQIIMKFSVDSLCFDLEILIDSCLSDIHLAFRLSLVFKK